jgi:hypothetical protein
MSTKVVTQQPSGSNQGWPSTFDMGSNDKVKFNPANSTETVTVSFSGCQNDFTNKQTKGNVYTYDYSGPENAEYNLGAKTVTPTPTSTSLTISGGSNPPEH